jgi:cobalt-zinc-cadmium efflux system membrane fusion protein
LAAANPKKRSPRRRSNRKARRTINMRAIIMTIIAGTAIKNQEEPFMDKVKGIFRMPVYIIISFFLLIGCNSQKKDEHDHGHDHGEEHSDHTGHGHEADHELEVTLTPDSKKLAEITIDTARLGEMEKNVTLPGEIGFNEERLVHVVPRFSGIARSVYKRAGNYVKTGETLAEIESNESLSKYKVRSSINGRIVQKHVTIGEFVSEGQNIFVIANLSNVWANLSVYAKDADYIKRGQKACIESVEGKHRTEGTISYISPVLDYSTRSLIARVILPNLNENWRPGMFIKAHVHVEIKEDRPLVKKAALQTVEGKECVFIPAGQDTFRPVEVKTGLSNNEFTQILAGLEDGALYVSKGAFNLKAKIVTRGISGHGHSH